MPSSLSRRAIARGLVAAHPIQRLGDHDIEGAPARVLKQPLDAGDENHARARDRRVAVDAGDLPASRSACSRQMRN